MPNLLPVLLLLLQDGAEETPTSSPLGGMLFPLLVIGLIFWFVVIGPERKQRKARTAMLASIQKGDKVMTTSGLYGTVVNINDDVLTLQVADNVRLRFSRSALQGLADPDEAQARLEEAKGNKDGEKQD